MRLVLDWIVCLLWIALAFPAPRDCLSAELPAPKEALERSHVVFVGKVKSSYVGNFPGVAVVFEVEMSWKGAEDETITVRTAKSGECAPIGFEDGKSYVVYAIEQGEVGARFLATDTCLRTRLFDEGAKTEIKTLGLPKMRVVKDLKDRPVGELIADLEALDGAGRAAASAELFRRGKEVLPALKDAGAKQVAPFGGTVNGTRRMSIVYSLLEGLPPNEPDARAGYRIDSFGLHLGGGSGEKDVVAMGKKHGFSVAIGGFRAEGQPQCYVIIDKGKSLAAVITSVLSSEPRVITINLNYFEQ
jgi:hypothetical protein